MPFDQQDPRLLRSLPPHAASALEQPFTQAEITESIARQRTHASPGASGVPYEYYKTFSAELAAPLTAVFNDSWERALLPSSSSRTLIRLLFKNKTAGADPSNLAHYRPVALKEAAHKIMTSALVARLAPLLPTLIPPSQAGFIPTRRSSDTALHLHFLLDLFRSNPHLRGLLVSLDQEKAYDRVDHSWIVKVFTSMGFGPRFLSLLTTIINDGSSHALVIVNGFLSQAVRLLRGVGQGDGLSCPIFSITFQPFIDALLLRRISSLPSSPLPLIRSDTLTSLAFADDVLTLLTDDLSPLRLADMLYEWEQAAGGRVLPSKSVQLGLNLAEHDQLFLPSTPRRSPTDVWKWVGYFFSFSSPTDPLYSALLSKLKSQLGFASSLRLSLPSRVTYANTRILSRIRHTTTALPLPPDFIAQLDTAILNFVWVGRHALSADKTRLPRSLGGLGLLSSDTINTTARFRFWDDILNPHTHSIWLPLAELSYASNFPLPTIHPFLHLTRQKIPTKNAFFTRSFIPLQHYPPPISDSISLPRLLGLPPTYPNLLYTPSSHRSPPPLRAVSSLSIMFSTPFSYPPSPQLGPPRPFTLSHHTHVAGLGPHTARLELTTSTFLNPHHQQRFKHLLAFTDTPTLLPPPEPPDYKTFLLQPPSLSDQPAPFITTFSSSSSALPPLPPTPSFWSSIWAAPTPVRAAQQLWLLAHGRSITEPLLHHIDPLTTPDSTCKTCDTPHDTLEHRYFTCALASTTWTLLHPVLNSQLGAPIPETSYSHQEILLGFPSLSSTTSTAAHATIRASRAVAIEEIELARTHHRKHPATPPSSPSTIIARILQRTSHFA